VAAMYTVTAREVDAAVKQGCDGEQMPLMSFPWLFTSELGKIATQQPARQVEIMQNQNQNQKTCHRKKKQVDDIKDPEAFGTVETEEGGILHYGEVLKLNFEEPRVVGDALSRQEIEVSQKRGEFDGRVENKGSELNVQIGDENSPLAMLMGLGQGKS
jgi:hypothetical protein